jgi:hypothetical protein
LEMRSSASKMLVVSSVLIVLLTLVPISSAQTTSKTQFASYSITGVAMGPPSFPGITINETVTPISSGMSNWTMDITVGHASNSFSRTVNSSVILFPYFPNVPNRSSSFTNEFYNYTLSVEATKVGNGTVTFNGTSQTVTQYTFNANASQHKYFMSVFGNASVFQSGLLYSATFNDSLGESFAVMLTGTNLPLNTPLYPTSTSSSSMTASSMTSTATSSSGTMVTGAAVLLIGAGALAVVSMRKIESLITIGRKSNLRSSN